MQDILAAGMMKQHVRIRCERICSVRVGLRTDGAPRPVVLSGLPEQWGAFGLSSGMDTERDRLRRREELMEENCARLAAGKFARHGFRLLALASDFLCECCQARLHDFRVDVISDADVAEWFARVCCEQHPRETRSEIM